MGDKSDQAGERGGLPLLWVTLAGGRRLLWWRYGPLLFLLLLLIAFQSFFGPAHGPEGPALGLAYACLTVIVLRGWMLAVDLVYRLASRERRMMLAHVASFGATASLALLVCLLALLLDELFSPSGHFFAVQGFFVILLTFWTAPIVFSILAYEPPGYYWQRSRVREGHWGTAAIHLRSILESYPLTLRPALLLVEVLLLQGRDNEARRLLKQITLRHPQAWGGWAAVGTLALEEEQWERAVEALERAYRLAPWAARGGVQLNLGLALLGAGDLEGGLWEIERAGRRLLPPHLRHFRRFLLMRIGQILNDPGRMLYATNEVRRCSQDAFSFLDWYETLDRSRAPTLAEDLYEAADWTRHLLGIRLKR